MEGDGFGVVDGGLGGEFGGGQFVELGRVAGHVDDGLEQVGGLAFPETVVGGNFVGADE